MSDASPGEATGVGDGIPGAEVVSLEWMRPQLVVRLSSKAGPLDAADFRLERVGAPAMVMPPTGSRRDGDLLDLRFNMMVGPGLRPPDSGRWHLRMSGPDGRSSRAVGAAASVDPGATARTFVLPPGSYRVTPFIEPSDGGLGLDVSFEPRPNDVAGPFAASSIGSVRRSGDARAPNDSCSP